MVCILDMSVFWAVAMDEHFSDFFHGSGLECWCFNNIYYAGVAWNRALNVFSVVYIVEICVLGRCCGGALVAGGLVAMPWFGKLGTDAAFGPGAFCLGAMAWASAAGLGLGDYWRDGLYVDSINKLLTGQT